jgi:hypothetical protein
MLPGRTKLGRIDLSLDEFSDSVSDGLGMRWSACDDTLRDLPGSQPVPAEVPLPESLKHHQLLRDVTAGYDGKNTLVSGFLDTFDADKHVCSCSQRHSSFRCI